MMNLIIILLILLINYYYHDGGTLNTIVTKSYLSFVIQFPCYIMGRDRKFIAKFIDVL